MGSITENPKPANVLVFGVGSIGAVYVHQLQQGGATVTAACRSNYESVKKNGFHLISKRYGDITYRPDHIVKSTTECSPESNFDFIVVTSKSFPGSKPSLADILRPAVRPKHTAILLAQNGINIEEEIAEAFPENPILSGVVYCPAVQTDPGTIIYPEMLNMLELGTYPSTAPQTHKDAAVWLSQIMIKGGGQSQVFDDIQVQRWSKLIMNAPWNPITALTLLTDGEFLLTSDPFARDLVWGIMMEIVELAEKVGVSGVTVDVARQKLSIAERRAETNTGRPMSMLQDVQQGRPFEVEAILGNACRLGRKHGVKMSRLETIYALAKGRLVAITKDQR